MSGTETLSESLSALLARHSALAERLLVPNTLAPEECEDFLREVVEAGAVVPPGPGRDALRTVLFFWSGEQVFRGDRARTAAAPTLAPYNPATAGPGDDVEAHDPVGGQVAVATLKLAGEADARRSVRLAAIARQWRLGEGGQKAGYLLSNRSAIDEASRYADRDPDIAALVEASKVALYRVENRRRTVERAFVLMMMLVFAAIAFASLALYAKEKAEAIASSTLAEKADAEAQQAKAAKLMAEADRNSLYEANAISTAWRDQIRKKVQDALNALRQRDLMPLREVLITLGGNRDDLAQLTVTAQPNARRPDVAGTPAGTQPQATVPAPVDGPTCPGFIWLGNKGPDSRLGNHRDPASLKAGETVTLDGRGSIRLREAWPPNGRDAQSKAIGVVPPSATVTLVDAPRAFPARDNDVWARVSVPRAYCSTVFLQYMGTQEKLDEALAVLHGLGGQVPPPEKVSSAVGLAQVRYFALNDLPVANQISAALAPLNGGKPLAVVSLTNLATRPSPGTLEVWLDLDR